jgi:hypothetical protein
MERVAAEEAFLGLRPMPGRLLVDGEDAPEGRLCVTPEGLPVLERLGSEETASQHLGHVLLYNRLHRLLSLALEDVVQLALELASEGISLYWLRGEQRCDEAAAVHLRGGLGQVLEEVDEAIPPPGLGRHLLADVGQHLVDENQGSQPFAQGQSQQFAQAVLGRGALPLLGFTFRVQELQALVPCYLVGQHAPGVPEGAHRALRRSHLHAGLHVELVEAEAGHPRRGKAPADRLLQLGHRRQGRQGARGSHHVQQGDQRVGFATAVGQFELAHGLVVLSRHPQHHVPHQAAQVVCREGQGEELRRVLVHGPLAALHEDFVEVRGEDAQRQLARSQILPEVHHLVPGSPGKLRHRSPLGQIGTTGRSVPSNWV